jgi:hypothetical protein
MVISFHVTFNTAIEQRCPDAAEGRHDFRRPLKGLVLPSYLSNVSFLLADINL